MIALDFGLGGFEAEIWRVVFLMTRVGDVGLFIGVLMILHVAGDFDIPGLLDPESGLYRFREAQGAVEPAKGFHRLRRHLVLEPVNAGFLHLKADHHGLEKSVVEYIVDVAQHVVVAPTRRNGHPVGEIFPLFANGIRHRLNAAYAPTTMLSRARRI